MRSLTLEKIRPDRCTFSAGAEFVNHPEHDVTAEQVFVQCVAPKAVHQKLCAPWHHRGLDSQIAVM